MKRESRERQRRCSGRDGRREREEGKREKVSRGRRDAVADRERKESKSEKESKAEAERAMGTCLTDAGEGDARGQHSGTARGNTWQNAVVEGQATR